MNILIQGIGLAAPRFSIDRQNALGFAKTMLHEPDRHTRAMEALYRMSAVHKRGSVLLEHEASGGAAIDLEQTFYPRAECPAQRGPSTATRNARFTGEALPLSADTSAPALEACREQHRWHWDGVAFELLHPPPRYPARGNEVSCVLSVRGADGAAVLLTGDAGEVAERRMLALHARRLPSQVLVLGHHGSHTSSSSAFVDAVAPRLAIASAGYRNRFGHPHDDVMRRLSWRGIETATTWRSGAVHIRPGADAPVWSAWRDRRHLWREP